MALLALGINHKTAPLEVREKVAFAPEQLVDALEHARASGRRSRLCALFGGMQARKDAWCGELS